MLKFAKANTKLRRMLAVPALQEYLRGQRKVYSVDTGRSGWTCPFAKECKSKVITIDGKHKIQDGKHTKFRCFSASQEALFSNTYKARLHNEQELKQAKTKWKMAEKIVESLPNNIGICRIDVAGDFFNQECFDAFIIVANSVPSVLFYAYTKSLPYWIKRLGNITKNLILTASYGGYFDNLIGEYGLRSAKVVFSESEANKLGLEIDHTDEHAANPAEKNNNFALLIHGVQPKGSEASEALRKIKKNKVEHSYS